jgi:hypothetical protein
MGQLYLYLYSFGKVVCPLIFFQAGVPFYPVKGDRGVLP